MIFLLILAGYFLRKKSIVPNDTFTVLSKLETFVFVPEFVTTMLVNAKNCMGPVAMLLAGIVIGGYNFKSLLSDKKVYAATFMRLIAIPAVMLLIMKLFGVSTEIQTFALLAFACPLGLNTIIYPAAYGAETKTGASMAMISHVLSVITIPLMYLIFIVLL